MVCVNGLPCSFTDQELHALFEAFGAVLSAEVMTGSAGLLAGFVQMATIKDTLTARRASTDRHFTVISSLSDLPTLVFIPTQVPPP
jgi:hypothetical protein